MKLLKLEIRDVRGIRNLILSPEGENVVIWGPNGSGKSAVVDALDFLLTGRIVRLTGEGTAGITLARHGPHIDSEPEQAVVRGVFDVPGFETPVELERCVARPAFLECDDATREHIGPFLALAGRGQHVLTRREVLQYITTEAGARAQAIQQLLNITAVESLRRAAVTAEHRLLKARDGASNRLEQARARINAIVGQAAYDTERVLEFVNERRSTLEGVPLAELTPSDLKSGLSPPGAATQAQAGNLAEVQSAVQAMRMLSGEQQLDRWRSKDQELRRELRVLRQDPEFEVVLAKHDLTEAGLRLLGDSGLCPLCETEWPPNELRRLLEARLERSTEMRQAKQRIAECAQTLRESVATYLVTLEKLRAGAQSLGLKSTESAFKGWVRDLSELKERLASPLQQYPSDTQAADSAGELNVLRDVAESLAELESASSASSPRLTPGQAAWDDLTRVSEAFVPLEGAQSALRLAETAYQHGTMYAGAIQEAQDEVLGELYEQVQDRFVQLYRRLHGSDEGTFSAKLQPTGPGLDFKVDFYGRGVHPPQALHSEGHQDSMGICLYLALAERLTAGVIDLTILDDVMMSVDADHRRELCRLLASAFPERQLIITTHDRTWASQLRTEGVVTSKRSIQFYGWEISSGPRVLHETDMWERIEEDMAKNDIPGAAHRLRRGSEEYLADACDALWAPVRFRLNARLELGDLGPAAMSRFRKLIGLAKKAADSWSDDEAVGKLTELESTAAQVFQRTQAEQWAVNENVHYNSWATFTTNDFRPVADAFHDLFDLFRCTECISVLRVQSAGPQPASVQCNCGRISWTLIPQT